MPMQNLRNFSRAALPYCRMQIASLREIIEKLLVLVILILLSPLIIVVLEIVFLITGESPVFKQKRGLVLKGKTIDIYKIRTIKTSYRDGIKIKASNIFYKSEYSDNVSLFCAILRKTGFDEILQLINVIKGDMSIVGPRPLMVADLELMKESDPALYERRTKILSKPGITGYWQVYGDRGKGLYNLIELDEYYERNKSLTGDILLIAKSIVIMITASHFDSIVKEVKRNYTSKKLRGQNGRLI